MKFNKSNNNKFGNNKFGSIRKTNSYPVYNVPTNEIICENTTEISIDNNIDIEMLESITVEEENIIDERDGYFLKHEDIYPNAHEFIPLQAESKTVTDFKDMFVVKRNPLLRKSKSLSWK
jgi:hypothetical protein